MKGLMISLILVLGLLVYSCGAGSEVIEDAPVTFDRSFKATDYLDTMKIDEDLYETVGFVTNNIFLFSLSRKSNPVVKVYNHKTGAYLGGFGTHGEGPEEFFRVNGSGFTRYGDDLVVSTSKNVRRYHISMVEDRLAVKKVFEAKVPGEYRPFNYGFILNDETVGGKVGFTLNEFSTFNVSGDTSSFGNFPDLKPELPRTAYADLFRSRFTAKPDVSKIASLYTRFPLLKINDLKKETSKQVDILPKNPQRTNLVLGPRKMSVLGMDLIGYFKTVNSNDDYIVALYREVTYEIVDPPTRMGNMRSVPLTDLFAYVFDWDGNPVAKILMEDWMTWYTITPDNRMIVFHPEEKDQLFVIDLKRLIG